ncbi:response regulator [Hansschlegelia plantiphila]|uniref:Response regulator n=1 Tax=Hansschlegelia plantiphila TaxID=374655 RepID=A0A9W6J4G1_9HYPH|nr:response regulator [Hansschlegelia plantiphila]GLK69169.1 response regulator [Hansschlegelia plantiphila]
MRVLIVEDEPIIALEIESIVQDRLPQACVVCATSVSAALLLIADELCMAMLDVDVTDGKTYPLADELRLRGVPFAFVSGALTEDLPERLSHAAFVRKPFCTADILRTIDALEAIGGRVEEKE